ncbi:HNH endonuclease [Blautia coccoides]|uniref:HNH endonuclease n=1 Tax=Blautia producta TaxID=33035 RepID=UPI00214A18F7|nr:HNH endonuclease signature motif containing protein [Blautia coccoides]MCR1985055.1 HNH endonuclease [Blautia coccoides]
MRRKLTVLERHEIYDKCQGHCAYCGCELKYEDMQVDHMIPLKIGGTDEMSNMLPSCRSCNHYKATFDVEGYRRYLSTLSNRLMRDSVPYKVGIRFGIIKHINDDVIFFFETLK